jgi:hypothetical protein
MVLSPTLNPSETVNRRKPSTLLVAAQHNHREIQAELGADSHIDATRKGQEKVLRTGTQ